MCCNEFCLLKEDTVKVICICLFNLRTVWNNSNMETSQTDVLYENSFMFRRMKIQSGCFLLFVSLLILFYTMVSLILNTATFPQSWIIVNIFVHVRLAFDIFMLIYPNIEFLLSPLNHHQYRYSKLNIYFIDFTL